MIKQNVAARKKGYLIGEVSKITGISKDTLRFYDKIGLLKPRHTDDSSKFRYYTYDQFWSIDIIACCRSLDIPIEKIREILSTKDNTKVLELLAEQREEAIHKRDTFKRIAEDIDWYTMQQKRIETAKKQQGIVIRSFPERRVLYGNNTDATHAYHLKLQEAIHQAGANHASIRRNYGFVLDEEQIYRNAFVKKGEYIRFDEGELNLDGIDAENVTVLPQGKYACCIVEVKNQKADFSELLKWLEERRLFPNYVIADEIGLQLFDYLDAGYLCEVKVLLEHLD